MKTDPQSLPLHTLSWSRPYNATVRSGQLSMTFVPQVEIQKSYTTLTRPHSSWQTSHQAEWKEYTRGGMEGRSYTSKQKSYGIKRRDLSALRSCHNHDRWACGGGLFYFGGGGCEGGCKAHGRDVPVATGAKEGTRASSRDDDIYRRP